MPTDISRRNFLKGGAAVAAGVAASGLALPQAVRASSGEELCTLLDLSKCIGCEECVSACREKWQATVPDPVEPMPQPFPPRVPVEDWSGRKEVQDRLTPYNFLYVEMLDVEHKGEVQELNVPRRCMHCLNPPCANLCPFGAGRIEKNGVVWIDSEVCLGGAKCKAVCPWHIPQRQSGVGIYRHLMPEYAGNGVMFKCHRCRELLKKGETPRCIEVCPENVQSIGPRDQMVAQAIALARQKAQDDGQPQGRWRDYIYGLDENGGTNTLYVSPYPFQAVNAAIAKQHQELAQKMRSGKGKGVKKGGRGLGRGLRGRPHMGPVANTMASSQNLTWALVLAPVAGLAGGLAKLFSKTKKVLPPQKPADSHVDTHVQGEGQ
ncbi:MAG: 4Fe-4S dicluster domain-containing protein [Desulfarculaceae bacterium]|jgi:Fe-S-cluster-containing dehydrogenase component